MNEACEFCGNHPIDCRCLELCPSCGAECSCESEPDRFDSVPSLDVKPDTPDDTERWLRTWGSPALRDALPK